MKPNRSNQRTNLVAGTWMPLTLTLLALALVGPSQLHAGQEADKDLAIRTGVSMSSKILKNSSSQLHELSVVAATQAIKDGSLTAVAYATALLRRYHDHANLNAFITVNNDAVLEASSVADSDRKAGKRLGPLHGVPIGVKDSINTHDLPTLFGTKILAGFRAQA